MKLFRIGFVLTLSLLLILMVGSITFGFFSAPEGPKAPTYPSLSNPSLFGNSSITSSNSSAYSSSLKKYEEERKKYEEEQKNFVKDKVVPYTRNVVVAWLILLIAFEAIGVVLTKFGSPLVGAGYAFSGVWAIFFGPIGGLIWFANSLVSSFSRQAEATFSIDPILQAVGVVSLVGVVALTALGILFYGKIKPAVIDDEPITVSPPPISNQPPPKPSPVSPSPPDLSAPK